MNRKTFLKFLVGMIPAIQVVKQFIIPDTFKGELGEYLGVKFVPSDGSWGTVQHYCISIDKDIICYGELNTLAHDLGKDSANEIDSKIFMALKGD